MDGIIASNPEIPGGTPVFAGTRVTVRFIECPEAGERLDDFLDEHPTVAREQAVAVCWSGPRRSAAPCASGFDAPIAVDRGSNCGKTRASCLFRHLS